MTEFLKDILLGLYLLITALLGPIAMLVSYLVVVPEYPVFGWMIFWFALVFFILWITIPIRESK